MLKVGKCEFCKKTNVTFIQLNQTMDGWYCTNCGKYEVQKINDEDLAQLKWEKNQDLRDEDYYDGLIDEVEE